LTGEQASETPPLQILYGRGAIRFLGSDCSPPFVYFLYVRVAFVITMSTDADRAAAEKLQADKKAAEAAAAAATASAWPTGGYNTFIPLLFITVLAILALCVDVSADSVV
jgi:hypothetical protein